MRKRCALALLLALCLALPLACGTALAEEKTVTIGTGVRERPEAQVTVSWDDGWFAGDASEYRHDLAVTAMALSAAAYTGQGAGARKALEDFGFGKVKSYHYEFSEESGGQTAYTFAVKDVEDQSGRTVKLVAAVIRGTGVYTEWAGNLNVGSGTEHEGFAHARDELMDSLKKYLTEAKITGRTKFLVTGHSRGGAAANLAAASLMDGRLAEKKDVYAYTFAAPAVSTEAKAEGYENIFNIISGNDLVPQVPLAEWGYRRYGTDRLLPAAGSEDYAARFDAMEKQYKTLTGRPYAVCRDAGTVGKLTDVLYQLAPTVSGPNMAMLSALLQGDMEGLAALVEGNALAALLMGRTAIRASSELVPLIQNESGGLAAAHCMAGYYSWLTACPEA